MTSGFYLIEWLDGGTIPGQKRSWGCNGGEEWGGVEIWSLIWIY